MKMENVLQQFEKVGIIPVVVLEDAAYAKRLGDALIAGGLPCAEVTFRTDAAEDSIRIMSQQCPGLLVGAGTVLTVEQVDRAMAAGAQFIVSPGMNEKVVQYCQKKEIPVVPGVLTPGEIEHAIELGLETVKFFPAEPSGGLPMIKALGAAYTKLRFMPTGGINIDNVVDYLKCDKILACGGSWMVKADLVKNEQFGKIEELCQQAASLVAEVRG